MLHSYQKPLKGDVGIVFGSLLVTGQWLLCMLLGQLTVFMDGLTGRDWRRRMTKVEEKTYLKPKLGRTVYCIYEGGILVSTVGYIGKDSFIIDSFGSSTYEDSWEWYYDRYNRDWFTNLAKAKKALLEQQDNSGRLKLKIVKVYDDWYEVREKDED